MSEETAAGRRRMRSIPVKAGIINCVNESPDMSNQSTVKRLKICEARGQDFFKLLFFFFPCVFAVFVH
jgi:hypothetical protein